jgi:hypothetical protein
MQRIPRCPDIREIEMNNPRYRAILRAQRYGTRETKVFLKRAIKRGWTVDGTYYALKFGPKNFTFMSK